LRDGGGSVGREEADGSDGASSATGCLHFHSCSHVSRIGKTSAHSKIKERNFQNARFCKKRSVAGKKACLTFQADCMTLRFALIGAVLLALTLHAQNLPTIRAKVGEPVLQELMGGCSMKCAFPWETAAIVPGKSPQPVYTLDDSDASTFWVDPNPGTGTKLQFQFPKKLPAELNGTPFYGLDLANGVIRPLAEFKSYSRLKKARLFYNGKPVCDILFADTYRWQRVNFDDILANQGDTVTLEILEVYPGTKFSSVAITELILQGAH